MISGRASRALLLRAAPLLTACLAAVGVGACVIKEKPQPTHRGIYVGGRDLNTFNSCGSDSLYWVEGKATSVLQTRYRELARRPFQPIYVELKAQPMPPGGQMPMAGHSGSIRVDTVLAATTQVPVECRPKRGPDPRDF